MSDFLASFCAVVLATAGYAVAACVFIGIVGPFVYWGGSLLGFWP